MTGWLRTAGAGLLAVLLLALAPGLAAAHAVLVSTDPVDGAKLAAGPARVAATFNEQLQPAFPTLVVIGPDDNYWQTGEPRVQGAVVSVALRPLGPTGRYTVYYQVTSADGHPVKGSWTFELTQRGSGTPGPPVPSGTAGPDVPIWPFVAGAVALVGAGALWASRRGG